MSQDEGLSMGCTCYFGNAQSKIEGCQEGQCMRACVCVCVCVKRVESDRQNQPKCRGPLGWLGAPHSPTRLFQGGEAQGSRIPQVTIGARGGPERPQSGGLGRCAGSQGRKV